MRQFLLVPSCPILWHHRAPSSWHPHFRYLYALIKVHCQMFLLKTEQAQLLQLFPWKRDAPGSHSSSLSSAGSTPGAPCLSCAEEPSPGLLTGLGAEHQVPKELQGSLCVCNLRQGLVSHSPALGVPEASTART